MKRAAPILAGVLIISIVVGACASMQTGGRDLVAKAVQAQGGAEALGAVKTISYKATVRQWEPEQSVIAGGEMLLVGDSTTVTVRDMASGATRIDWVKNFQSSARTFTFSEVVTREAGYVAGIDSSLRTKQGREANPPAHSMSGQRLTTAQREILRSSPLLVLEMSKNPDRVASASSVTVGGVRYPAADYRVGGSALTVLFDPATGLPARVRSLDYDNIWGDVTWDLALADYQTVSGVRMAMSHKYELNGRTVMEVKLSEPAVNAPAAADRFAIPAPFLATARKPAASGAVPYQWIIRRQFVGFYLDSDQPSWDTQASPGLRLQELAPGVQHVVGGSHNSLIVEMKDYVIVFDAPVSDWQSNWTISAARGKYVRKPVKYLVLTHHHMDHAGGLRAYADAGATIVVGQGTAAHYRQVLAAPFSRNPDLTARDLSKTPIVEVAGKHVISDGTRQVELYVLEPNPHADGILIGYVADAKLGFVTDIWSPGAAPLGEKLNPAQAALVATVKKAGIAPDKFAGGHGTTADYAPLAALEGK